MIINSGIQKVVIRIGEDRIRIVDVDDWVVNDDSLAPGENC